MVTLAVIWIVWCALHSLLISRGAQNLAKKFFGHFSPLYRLYYVGFSCISLVPVLWYQIFVPSQIVVASSWLWLSGQAILLLYAGFMFYAGGQVYDMGYFLGLNQWQNFRKHKETGSLPFHSDGILAYVRHPWYSGGVAFLWGFGSCTDVYVLTRTILTVYIILGTILEERRLIRELGEQYRIYCRQVPMLIPWKILRGK